MIWLRMQRFELISLGVAVGAWGAAAIFIAWRLNGFAGEFPDCFGLTTTAPEVFCRNASLQFAGWDQTAQTLLWLMLALPLLLGVVLGAPLVARELEEETAQIAWSYALSRLAWLRARTVPIIIVVVLMLGLLALSAEVLAVARLGGDDPGFQRFDQRGPLVVLRGLLSLVAACLIGAWLGRTLPTILAAAALSAVLVFGLTFVLDAWRRTEAVIVERNSSAGADILANAMVMEPVAILPDGQIISDLTAELPEGVSFDALRVVPSSEYWTWVGREAAALTLITTAGLVATAAIVRRRRPL